MKRVLIYLLLLICVLRAEAKHIVGGEIIYDELGNNNYRITLKVYRDCLGGGAPFDGLGASPAILTVYEGDGTFVNTYDIGGPSITNIPPSINNPCIQPPNNICVEEGIYTYTLNLPKKTGGYYVVYQRCCRNNSILNLLNPGSQGSTYYTRIPGPEDAPVNNSPRFNKFPPIYLCAGVPFSFDHSATDPDGDQLIYSLCATYGGLSENCPALGGNGCPTQAPPPPYANVIYSPGYSGSYPIAANPAFSINPLTGQLAGTPTLQGQYVVGVCIQEIRGGKLLNTHYRDFQFNVSSCIVNVVSIIKEPEKKCNGNTIDFVNQSFGNLGGLTYFWDFGVPNLSTDTSSLQHPSFTYPDTGTYVVTLIANPNKPCSDTMKKTFYIYPSLSVGFQSPPAQCLRGNQFTFINGSAHHASCTFTWSFGSFATPSVSYAKSPTGIVFTQPGKYFATMVAQQFACRDSVSDSVRVYPRPSAKINNIPPGLCDPAIIGFSNGSSSVLPINYTWLFSNGATSNAFEPVQLFSPAGAYSATLVVTTTSLCADTSVAVIKNIMVHPKPSANFYVTPTITTVFDPEVTVKNSSSDDVNTWHYDFGDGTASNFSNPGHSYAMVKGNYTLTQIVTNSFGCKDTSFREIKILPEFRFWIPNCFTPNYDNLNDVFKPVAIGVVDYQFEIYDHWGERLFKTDDHTKGWDGSFEGAPCKEDVYVWRITFTDEVELKRHERYGHVTLLYRD